MQAKRIVGAIMQTPNSAGGLGHVAYVTSVDASNGEWTISEMNVRGLDVIDRGRLRLQRQEAIISYTIRAKLI
jgi:surface antigen